ncbi:hypothetical protein JW979_06215 [bacterium]|nr:hypothetical protein [candidate division CSSED10-310 bacterium]
MTEKRYPSLSNTEKTSGYPVNRPLGVVIGDSIAIGYYDEKLQPLESRLQPVYDPSFINPPGTFAYELEKHTNFSWLNQAIGGQTTDELWNRWSRDALAMESDASDGRGVRTLMRKPDIIILDTGTSELRAANPESLPIIKHNIFRMIKTAVDNDIFIIVINIAPIKTAVPSHISQVNSWISAAPLQFGDRVRIYDAYSKVAAMGYKDFQLDKNNHFCTNARNYIAGIFYPLLRFLHLVTDAELTPMLDKKYNWGDGCHWTAQAVKDVAEEIVLLNRDVFIERRYF